VRDDGGIERVGLGEVVHGFGEVAHLACVDDDGGEPLRQQGSNGGLLVRAGRFKDDPLGGVGPDPSHQFGDASSGVGEALAEGGWANVNIEEVLGDIDADEGALHKECSIVE
jgi:hypothetical protein